MLYVEAIPVDEVTLNSQNKREKKKTKELEFLINSLI